MSDLPRVTQILADVGLSPDFSRVPPDVLEVARQRGSAVHAALEALTYGYFDESDVTPEMAPYISAYRKFLAESGFEAKYAEITVTSTRWRFCGHPDMVGFLLGRRVLIDAKSGGAERVEYQLAAYRIAFNEERPTEPVDSAAVLQLRRDGTYRFREIEPVEMAKAEVIFQAATLVFHAKYPVAA